MRLPGLIDLVGLAVTLAFALPVALFGVNLAVGGRPVVVGMLVLDGRTVGVGLLALAVLMVALPHYLWSPPSLGDLTGRAVGRISGGKER